MQASCIMLTRDFECSSKVHTEVFTRTSVRGHPPTNTHIHTCSSPGGPAGAAAAAAAAADGSSHHVLLLQWMPGGDARSLVDQVRARQACVCMVVVGSQGRIVVHVVHKCGAV
eukprot:1157517-Pelagomonas_calceolata.AAC.1